MSTTSNTTANTTATATATIKPPDTPSWVLPGELSLRVETSAKSNQCVHQKKGERCTVNGERSRVWTPGHGSFLPALSAGHSRRDVGLLHGVA